MADGGGDLLESYRDRAMSLMAVAGVAILLPFAANNWIQGRIALAAAILVVMAALALDALAIRRGSRPPIPYAWMLLPMVAAIGGSLSQQGIIGAFWCYPAILFFYFVLRPRTANLCSLSIVVAGSLAVYLYVGFDFATRVLLSLLLIVVMVNITLNIIGDLQRRLAEQAVTDPLTGAFNRRYMEARLDEALRQGDRAGTVATAVLIDIDRFKEINDRFGHAAGDRVLRRIVHIIRERTRRVDLLFRLGGDELMLLLADTYEPGALRVADELRATVESARMVPHEKVTVSIGVAALAHGDTVDSWMRRADEALYHSKKFGRNRVSGRERAEG